MTRIQIFSKYLDPLGFDLAPLAWHISGMPLADEQHTEIIKLLGSDVSG
jgi:hypothetical protein